MFGLGGQLICECSVFIILNVYSWGLLGLIMGLSYYLLLKDLLLNSKTEKRI